MPKSYNENTTTLSGQDLESGLPQNQKEVQNELVIDGSDNPYEIDGPVFAKDITIINGGQIKGPIYSQNTLSIKNIEEPLVVQSGINVSDSFTIEKPEVDSKQTRLGYSLENMDCLIKGDISSEDEVILNNTIVLGSIEAPKIELNHSIVVGALTDAKEILVNNSTIGIYITQQISFKGNNGLLIAGGKSAERPEILPDKRGKKNLNLRYMPLCRIENYGCGMGEELKDSINPEKTGLTCSLWQQNRCPISQNVSIYKKDFAEIEINGIKNWYLGLQNRSLSLNKLKSVNSIFQRIIDGIFAYEHLSEEDKQYEKNLWSELSESEQKVLSLATE